MTYRQVELRSVDSKMVCWLEDSPMLKRGLVITLKEIPDVRWKIEQIYNVQPEHQRRTWRVGGIS